MGTLMISWAHAVHTIVRCSEKKNDTIPHLIFWNPNFTTPEYRRRLLHGCRVARGQGLGDLWPGNWGEQSASTWRETDDAIGKTSTRDAEYERSPVQHGQVVRHRPDWSSGSDRQRPRQRRWFKWDEEAAGDIRSITMIQATPRHHACMCPTGTKAAYVLDWNRDHSSISVGDRFGIR